MQTIANIQDYAEYAPFLLESSSLFPSHVMVHRDLPVDCVVVAANHIVVLRRSLCWPAICKLCDKWVGSTIVYHRLYPNPLISHDVPRSLQYHREVGRNIGIPHMIISHSHPFGIPIPIRLPGGACLNRAIPSMALCTFPDQFHHHFHHEIR